jgi:hypothetical protein
LLGPLQVDRGEWGKGENERMQTTLGELIQRLPGAMLPVFDPPWRAAAGADRVEPEQDAEAVAATDKVALTMTTTVFGLPRRRRRSCRYCGNPFRNHAVDSPREGGLWRRDDWMMTGFWIRDGIVLEEMPIEAASFVPFVALGGSDP